MKYVEPQIEIRNRKLETIRTDVIVSSGSSDGTNEDNTKVPEIWP